MVSFNTCPNFTQRVDLGSLQRRERKLVIRWEQTQKVQRRDVLLMPSESRLTFVCSFLTRKTSVSQFFSHYITFDIILPPIEFLALMMTFFWIPLCCYFLPVAVPYMHIMHVSVCHDFCLSVIISPVRVNLRNCAALRPSYRDEP